MPIYLAYYSHIVGVVWAQVKSCRSFGLFANDQPSQNFTSDRLTTIRSGISTVILANIRRRFCHSCSVLNGFLVGHIRAGIFVLWFRDLCRLVWLIYKRQGKTVECAHHDSSIAIVYPSQPVYLLKLIYMLQNAPELGALHSTILCLPIWDAQPMFWAKYQ